MKINLLVACAIMAVVGVADAATSITMRNANGDTIVINRDNDGRVSGNRGTESQTTKRAWMYDNLASNKEVSEDAKTTSTVSQSKQTYVRGETYKKTARRKYFIANPFYQPLKNQFGTVTTGEYMQGTFKFGNAGGSVDRKLTEWSVKEDLSFGITDRIALQAMAKYNSDKLSWKNDTYEHGYKSKGLNVYGLGIQGRIVDTNDWISTLSGYYEHQRHGIDYFIADFKAGYKTGTSTIYGLARAWAINMEGDVYGDYITDDSTSTWGLMIFADSRDMVFMGEGGLGVWTVLAEDWTLNVEGLYGLYDWHNQLSIKGAFGWQPNDYFALNLYAKTSLYDSANGKHLTIVEGDLPFNRANWEAGLASGYYDVDLSKYKEWSVGLQVMFQF